MIIQPSRVSNAFRDFKSCANVQKYMEDHGKATGIAEIASCAQALFSHVLHPVDLPLALFGQELGIANIIMDDGLWVKYGELKSVDSFKSIEWIIPIVSIKSKDSKDIQRLSDPRCQWPKPRPEKSNLDHISFNYIQLQLYGLFHHLNWSKLFKPLLFVWEYKLAKLRIVCIGWETCRVKSLLREKS